jgi:hypothetical protein
VLFFGMVSDMKMIRAMPESRDVTKGITRFNKMSAKERRAYVVKFVAKQYPDKPDNYRKVVVRNMLKAVM